MTDPPQPTLVATPTADSAGGWEPVALRRADVQRAIDGLLAAPRTGDGLRHLLVVHPRAGATYALAPSIQVSIEVLAPGETARLPRTNASALALQISGESAVTIDGQSEAVAPHDLYSVPPLAIEAHVATGTEPSVRIVYSNAALLRYLGALRVETTRDDVLPGAGEVDLDVRNDGRYTHLGRDAWRLEYERVVDPPWVPFRSWTWRWADVVRELDRMASLGERYNGRRVCVLYDPATGRTNGTTPTLFASMCIRPANIIDRTHRHTAAAVNYFIDGTGWSTVGGTRIEWGPGDLIFIAPAWEVHHHASNEHDVYQLAVQDNPLHLAMGSLVWQEDLEEPIRLLGAEPGFVTNRDAVERAT